MTTKWTPGPWNWDAGDIGAEASQPYCNVFTDDETIIATVNDRFNRQQGRANARLMAAAPELVEALADAVEALEYMERNRLHINPPTLDRSRALMARINGD